MPEYPGRTILRLILPMMPGGSVNLEAEIFELKIQLATSQKLANHEASKNEKPTPQTGQRIIQDSNRQKDIYFSDRSPFCRINH